MLTRATVAVGRGVSTSQSRRRSGERRSMESGSSATWSVVRLSFAHPLTSDTRDENGDPSHLATASRLRRPGLLSKGEGVRACPHPGPLRKKRGSEGHESAGRRVQSVVCGCQTFDDSPQWFCQRAKFRRILRAAVRAIARDFSIRCAAKARKIDVDFRVVSPPKCAKFELSSERPAAHGATIKDHTC